MPVAVVIIILVAWAVIVGPSLLRRRSRSTDGIHSITHFHHQLRILEHSAPEPIVAPAYRLRALDGDAPRSGVHYPGDRPPVLTVVGASELPRPALAFLGEPPHGHAESAAPVRPGPPVAEVPDARAAPRRAVGAVPSVARPEPPDGHHLPRRPPDVIARQAAARRRRRDTLVVLAGATGVGLLGSAATGAAVLWALTALCAVALGAYVTLLVHLRQRAQEHERKLRYLPERDDPVRRATPVGGRLAHPSYGRAAGH